MQEHLRGGQLDSLSTLDTIHPIDMILLHVISFVAISIERNHVRLIGFHDNHSYIYDVTSGRHFGFLSFQILFKPHCYELQNDKKTAFSDRSLQKS